MIVTRFDNVTANLIHRPGKLGFACVILVEDLAHALELYDLGHPVMGGDADALAKLAAR